MTTYYKLRNERSGYRIIKYPQGEPHLYLLKNGTWYRWYNNRILFNSRRYAIQIFKKYYPNDRLIDESTS
jgi:hypothetical protein